jgi:hypothetical protein
MWRTIAGNTVRPEVGAEGETAADILALLHHPPDRDRTVVMVECAEREHAMAHDLLG